MPRARSVVSNAKLIALCTLVSRVTGLAREVLLGQAFGLSWVQDAFVYGFQFPNLFRRLFGEGSLAPVFVPTFTRTLERDGRESAWRLLARTFALLTVALTVAVVAIEIIILLIWLFAPGGDAAAAGSAASGRGLLLGLTALMLPFMVSICLLALLSAILNCVGSFVPAALAPVLLNLCMIAGIVWIAPRLAPGDAAGQAWVLGWTVLAAGALQLLCIFPALRANGIHLGWNFDLRDAGVREMLRLLPPVALGQGVLAFGVFLDSQICIMLTQPAGGAASAGLFGAGFAYPLREGALSSITYAQRLYQFPLGVLAISLATAALPQFSRLAARQEWAAWGDEFRRSLRLASFEGLLAGVPMIVFAEPMIRLLFQYRRFDADDTTRTAAVLFWYGFGLWAFAAQHMVMRAFYSLGDARTPLRISVAILPLNAALTLALVWFDGLREAAFAISSALTASASIILSLWLIQRRTGVRLLDRAMLSAAARMLLSATGAGLALWSLAPLLAMARERVAPALFGRAVETFGGLGIVVISYLVLARLMRLPEVEQLLGRRA